MTEETHIENGEIELDDQADASFHNGMLFLQQDEPEMYNEETIGLSAKSALKLLEFLYERRYSLYMATTLSLGDDLPDWIATGNPDSSQDIDYTMQRLRQIRADIEAIPDRTEPPDHKEESYLYLKWSVERAELDKKIRSLQAEAQSVALQFGFPDRIHNTLKAIDDLTYEKQMGRERK